MDGSRWSEPFRISGEGVEDEDRLPSKGKVAEIDSPPHMLNFFECVRSRETPNAPIEAGHTHSVAVIMADMSLRTGRRMAYDKAKRRIRPA